MKQILVGIDGSKESRHAAEFAAHLAHAGGEKLVLVGAAYVEQAFGAPELMARARSWEAEEQKMLTRTLDEIAAGINEPGLEIEKKVVVGPPAATLAELAQDKDVDMVVVGHRGRGKIARALTGSVADRLVQIAPKPVLVCR